MPGANYYLLTSLPSLGELGSVPPFSASDLRQRVAEAAGPGELVDAILLSDDLLQHQAFLAGEIEEVRPAVLTAEQVRNEQPFPPALAAGQADEPSPGMGADRLWAAYYRWTDSVAQRQGSTFVREWTRYEVSLRNAVAAERARELDLDEEPYLVATDLGDPDANFERLLGEWLGAPDPLAGLRVLDRARWNWLVEHEGYFTFANDELAAYAAKLMLLLRWHRLGQVDQPGATEPQAGKTDQA